MYKLLSFVLQDTIYNNQMRNLKENQDQIFQEPLRQAHRKLVADRYFLDEKMRGNTYIPRDSTTFEESKSEILDEIKKSLGRQLNERQHWDEAFKSYETRRWLDLFERGTKNNFQARKDAPSQVETVLGREVPIEYGSNRDMEMLHDFLTNYMGDTDATQICVYVVNFFL